MSTSRGRPPRGFCLAGGIIGPTMAHWSSVRSDGYFFRDWFSCTIDAHSSTDGICANYLRNLLFCQVIFPDSLSKLETTQVYAESSTEMMRESYQRALSR